MRKKFYKKAWFTWLLLITVPPIGVYLLWRYRRYTIPKKLLLSVLFFGLMAAEGSSLFVLSHKAGQSYGEVRIDTDEVLSVHFLDVGQGLSILVQADQKTLLYDGGDREASDLTVAYLQEQGIETIDYLIASHYDEDHLAGLIGCLNVFEVKEVIGPDYEHDTQLYDSFAKTVKDCGIEIQHLAVGTRLELGMATIRILAPEKITEEPNGNSMVVKLEHGNNSFIFTGDATAESESAMCASGLPLDTDVLSVAHHGSASATGWDFLEATTPECAVISCGAGNSYGHPDQDVMDRLRDMEIEVFRNDKQGTVIARSDGDTITWDQEPCNDYTPGEPVLG